jgi:hypothetical protein
MKNACELAEQLCIEAEALGLCHPTENMISDLLGKILVEHATEMELLREDRRDAVNLIKMLNAQTHWHGRQYRSECGKFLSRFKK